MKHSILILTNDNVFYLLIERFVHSTGKGVSCKKISHHYDIDISDKNTADMLIVDGKMTLASPINLIHELRYKQNYKIPIWLVTEINSQDYLKKAIDVGVNKIINKPFDPIHLANNIVSFVARQT